MTLKNLYTILSIVVAVIICMAVLNFKSNTYNKAKNGFNRTICRSCTNLELVIPYSDKIIDICALYGNDVFVATQDPMKVISTNLISKVQNPILLEIKSSPQLKSNFSTIVEYPMVYLFGSNTATLITYNIKSREYRIDTLENTFSRAVRISASTIIKRGLNKDLNNQYLTKEYLDTKEIHKETNITPQFYDGGFLTDGLISYNKDLNRIIYTHFYCNKIFMIDTNLNLQSISHTIDTFSSYQAKSLKNNKAKTEKTYGLTSPPRIVSLYSQSIGDKLYIYSNVKADNESDSLFRNNSVIDIYNASNGTYQKSIYIPNYDGIKMFKFKVYKNKLAALFKNSIVVYSI